MENYVIKNSKRPYHSTMGPLIEDFNSLSKRRKKLFENINTHIDSLIKLIQDTDDKLNTHHSTHLNGTNHVEYNHLSDDHNSSDANAKLEDLNCLKVSLKYESSDTGNETSSTDINNETTLCEYSKQTIKDLATTVKSFDIYRKINKSLREFNVEFLDVGRSLLGSRGNDNQEMLSPVKLDEKLVCRMIGMHLLHYGLFDVYEQLKIESEKLWGPNHIGTIGEVMVTAYRTLHGLIDNIRKCNIEPVLEWTKNQHDNSNLHVQRFNEIMINLYKIRFLSDLFNSEDPDFDFNSQIISEVKNSGITSLWKMHNDEIGKLITQVILGQNTPTNPEFEALKNRTIKMFTKLFCDTGILIKKPETCDRKPIVTEPTDEPFPLNGETKEDQDPEDQSDTVELLNLTLNDFTFACRPILNDHNPIPPNTEKLRYKSWLLALAFENEIKAIPKIPEDKGVRLRDDWLHFKSKEKRQPKQPRMAYRYLNSNSLEHGRRLNFIKNRLNSKGISDQTLSLSRSMLINTLCDPETICRQNLSISDNMLSNIPYYMENQLYEDEMSSLGRMGDPEEWSSTRGDRTTTVLIATGTEESEENILGLSNMGRLIDNYSSTLSSGEEGSQRSTPTFSLTVFAGPSIFRDSRLSSQLLEADIISQRLLNVSPGSRIRIRFPSRTEEALENAPTRRETSITPYEPVSVEPALPSEEEEQSTTIERSSITLRDILRMIMRGLRAETQPAVVRFRGSRSQQNLEDTRTSSQESESPKDKDSKHKRLVRPKPALENDPYVDSEYVKVHLPYESPLSVVTCAGQVTFPYLLDVLKVLFKERCEVSSKVGMWLKSNQQLPVESDLGPAFHFHSYLTCAVSKDQTSNENLPIMLSCGHVICKICHDRLSGKRRKRQFKCPMCPTIVEPNQTIELYLDWNCSHNHCVY